MMNEDDAYFCKNCKKELELKEIFNGSGVCPFCSSDIGFFGYFTHINEKGDKEKARIGIKNVKLD